MTRRLIVHKSVKGSLVERLKKVLAALAVGNPLELGVLVGPLIDSRELPLAQDVCSDV